MYLARLQLPLDKALQHGLHDSYAWHRLAWQCYPGCPDAARDFLTRLDLAPDRCALFVLGQRRPDRPDLADPEEWSVKAVAPSFLEHARYRFDVRVNPTRKVKADSPDGSRRKNGRREALIDPEAQRAWLERKAEAGGFSLEQIWLHPAERQLFRGKQGRGLHIGVRCSGLLRVTDAGAFAQTFQSGLGSAKAFGFGLLLLQPILSSSSS